MAAGVTITNNRLGALASRLRPQVSQIIRKAAFDVEARSKELVPVDTGALQNSIQSEMTGDLSAVVAVGMEYAPYVEYGTSRSAAQPYLTPAADAVRPGLEAAIQDALKP